MHIAPILHWLNVELWGPGWANVMMPSVWTLVGILVADIRNGRRHKRQKNHVIDNQALIIDLVGQIESMSDRLKSAVDGEDHVD